jgi:hypothetical protein
METFEAWFPVRGWKLAKNMQSLIVRAVTFEARFPVRGWKHFTHRSILFERILEAFEARFPVRGWKPKVGYKQL